MHLILCCIFSHLIFEAYHVSDYKLSISPVVQKTGAVGVILQKAKIKKTIGRYVLFI